MMDFWQSIDFMQLLRCFIVGGLICIIWQILIDKTKLTPARILVIFVTTGAILGGLGIYKYLIDFARNNNIYNITLEVDENNINAIKLYEKCGFIKKAIRKNYYNNSDGILMELIIWKMFIF